MQNNQNLVAILQQGFERAPDKTVFSAGGDEISYAAFGQMIGRMANALAALGVGPGDRVTAQIEKSIGNICLYLATLKCGGVFHPLNTAYTASEVEFFVSDARPTLLVVPQAAVATVTPIAEANGVKHVMTMEADGSGGIADLAAESSAEHATVERTSDDLACLLYTSGTTGRSKGAMITHGNLVSNLVTLNEAWRFSPDDVLLHALPVFHVHGLHIATHLALYNSCTMHWLDRFDAGRIVSLLPSSTVMMGVPTFYTRLLGDASFSAETCRNMRLFISGSAPLLAETHREFEARTGHRILERYGMTETGMMTSNPYDGERLAGTVGYALDGVDIRIADDDGSEVERGEIGVIEARGPNIFAGYWNLPEKTAEEFRSDGYFVTGDLARMDDDGRITIVGRAKDLIISGGFNVYPKEIEEVLDDMEEVSESAVIGIPHPDFGEGVVAVVIPAAGGNAPDEAEIIGRLGERLAKFKVPKRVFFEEALPRNTMGKVQKAALRDRHAKIFSP